MRTPCTLPLDPPLSLCNQFLTRENMQSVPSAGKQETSPSREKRYNQSLMRESMQPAPRTRKHATSSSSGKGCNQPLTVGNMQPALARENMQPTLARENMQLSLARENIQPALRAGKHATNPSRGKTRVN